MKDIAQKLFEAERDGRSVTKFTAGDPGFTLARGYEAQRLLEALHVRSGARIVGRKMGMTSRAKMEQMGISSPIHGFLTDRMRVESGGALALGKRIHPKAEPEIAFVMAREVRGDLPEAELIGAVEGITGAIEIIDSRFTNFDFGLPDVVADNCSGSAFVLGPALRKPHGLDLADLGITLERNGEVAQRGSSAAILGNPLRALAALVRILGERNEALPAGAVVLAGAATAAIPVRAGDSIRAHVDRLGTVELRIEA